MIELVAGLPAALPAAVLIVQHIPPHTTSNLAKVLRSRTPLEVRQAEQGDRLRAGVIYTAVADRHLLVEEGRILLTNGPRENRHRPCVDALFRSVGYTYRGRAIGVILSGALNDGASGMYTIKRFGGTSVIQSPAEAVFDSMPRSIQQYADVDYELPAREIGPLLGKMARISVATNHSAMDHSKNTALAELDLRIARGENALESGVIEMGRRSALTCPECHGALTEYQEGRLQRYRCHTGHAHTAESLLASIDQGVENSMWEAMRGLEENKILLDHLAQELERRGESEVADSYRRRAATLAERSQLFKEAIFAHQNSDVAEIGTPANAK